jgi:eukaryotic-like serine/threonine-protein kinase
MKPQFLLRNTVLPMADPLDETLGRDEGIIHHVAKPQVSASAGHLESFDGGQTQPFEPVDLESTSIDPENPPVSKPTTTVEETSSVDVQGSPFAAATQYQLIKIHAHGGLGRVWQAVDSQLRREVAIKEMLPKKSTNASARRRFLIEAQVTGQLTHPHIVPVYQLSTSPQTGNPFYVMRMLRGESLRSAIQAARGPSGALTPIDRRRFLTMFISVCNALAYANARGVIHRDLKPENVILGEYGEVLVIDWGLAKLAGHDDEPDEHDAISTSTSAMETVQGSVLGTPMYLAPEQAAGQIDRISARTDVFGLGGILFEILTGQPPHEKAPIRDLLQRISTTPCRRPREVDASVPAALDAICATAIAFAPEARYATATDLAHDVELYLAGEPVSVYREPWITRTGRWARRHRTLVTTTSALMLASIVGLSINAWMVGKEQQRTAVALERAETNLRAARSAVDEMLTRVADEDLENVPQMELVRQDVFVRALDFYKKFADDSPHDPELRAEVARAHERVGDIATLLGKLDIARQEYQHSIELLDRLPVQSNSELSDKVLLQAARTCDSYGEALRQSGELELATVQYKRAIQFIESSDQLKNNLAAVAEYARVRYNMGLMYIERGMIDEAISILSLSIQDHQRLLSSAAASTSTADEPVDPHPDQRRDWQQGLARAYINRGIVHKSNNELPAAEQDYNQAITQLRILLQEVPRSHVYRFGLAKALQNLGNLLMPDASRREGTEQAYRDSLKELTTLVQDYPQTPAYMLQLANVQNGLGSFLFNQTRNADAEIAWRSADKIFTELLQLQIDDPEYSSLAALTKNNLAHACFTRDDHSAAKELYEAAVKLQNTALAANPEDLQRRKFLRQHLRGLAPALLKLEQGDEAIKVAEALCQFNETTAPDYLRAAGFIAQGLPLVLRDFPGTKAEADTLRTDLINKVISYMEKSGLVYGFGQQMKLIE